MDAVFERTATGLYESGAFLVMGQFPLVFASKTVHPVYIDTPKLQNVNKHWDYVVNQLLELIRAHVDVQKISRISGGEIGDFPFSIGVALESGIPHVMLRKEAKAYGTQEDIRGAINPGDYVVHVADLLTTGGSAIGWIHTIRAHGGIIDHYYAVVDRLQGGMKALAHLTPPVSVDSLVQVNGDFLQIGVRLGKLTQEQAKDVLDNYFPDPLEWGLNYLRNNPAKLASLIEADKEAGHKIISVGYAHWSEELFSLAFPYLHNPDSIRQKISLDVG